MRRPVRSRYAEPDSRVVEYAPQPLVAVTAHPLSEPYRTKKKVAKPNGAKNLSVQAQRLLVWVRREHFRQNLKKMSVYNLKQLSMGDLRTILSLFDLDPEEVRQFRRDDYIRKILGYRENPVTPEPIPYGSLPKFD